MIWLLLSAIAALVAAGFFGLIESSCVAIDRLSLGVQARSGKRRQQMLEQLLTPPTRLIMTAIIGADLAVVLGSTFFSRWSQMSLPTGVQEIVSTIGLTLVFFIAGELIPKSIGITYPNQIATAFVLPMKWLRIVLHPLLTMVQGVSNSLLKLFGVKQDQQRHILSRDDIIHMVRSSRRSRSVHKIEQRMITSIMNLSETRVFEVMVPLIKVIAIEQEAIVEDAIKLVLDKDITHLPVYKDRIDDIVGVISVEDMLAVSKDRPLSHVMRQLAIVHEEGSLEKALVTLRESVDNMAAVVDEYGGVCGMLFFDDIIGKMMGNGLEDRKEQQLKDDLTALDMERLSAQMPIKEVEAILGVSLPQGPYTTLGGMLVSQFGYIPQVGETICIGDYEFSIAEGTARMIELVMVRGMQ